MKCFYISVEKNLEGFEFYKGLWQKHGVEGIRVDSMTEGIKKAVEIEKSATDELSFIAIVARNIDYLPQLKILSEETNAPILIATFDYSEDEHHEALNNGADFYAKYSDEPEKNIRGVLSVMNSIEQRSKKRKVSGSIKIHDNVLVAPSSRKVFFNDRSVSLTKKEYEILGFFMSNRLLVLTYGQIYSNVWGEDYNNESTHTVIRNHIKKINRKFGEVSPGYRIIVNEHGVGYKLRPL